MEKIDWNLWVICEKLLFFFQRFKIKFTNLNNKMFLCKFQLIKTLLIIFGTLILKTVS